MLMYKCFSVVMCMYMYVVHRETLKHILEIAQGFLFLNNKMDMSIMWKWINKAIFAGSYFVSYWNQQHCETRTIYHRRDIGCDHCWYGRSSWKKNVLSQPSQMDTSVSLAVMTDRAGFPCWHTRLGGNWSVLRKPETCNNPLTNFST